MAGFFEVALPLLDARRLVERGQILQPKRASDTPTRRRRCANTPTHFLSAARLSPPPSTRILMPSRRRQWTNSHHNSHDMVGAPEDWVEAADRFSGLDPANAFGNQMLALVNALTPRFSDSVGVTTWMFELIFTTRTHRRSS